MIKDYLYLQPQFLVIDKIFKDGHRENIYAFALDVVTTVGKNRAASHLANSAPGKTWFTDIALGTNQDAESTEDLSLGDEFYRVTLNSVWAVGETVFGNSIIEGSDIGVDEYTVWELGLLNAAAGGDLICRQVLGSAVTVDGTEKLDILWGVIVS